MYVISPEKLAKMIDHTNVNPDASKDDIKKLCDEAAKYNFSCACVTPTNVSPALEFLTGSEVDICAVVGFPFGTNKPETKAFEAQQAVEDGASEIDMVLNIGALKSGKNGFVIRDIGGVVEFSEESIVKVIIETALLNNEEKIRACILANKAGADFIKTSTGVGYPGANVEDVKLIKNTIGSEMKIKASGGIRDLKTALAMIEAGASKIGTSTGPQIMDELLKMQR